MEQKYLFDGVEMTTEQLLQELNRLKKENEEIRGARISKETIPDGISDKHQWMLCTGVEIYTKLSCVIRKICFEPVDKGTRNERVVTLKEMSYSDYKKYADVFSEIIDVLDKHTVIDAKEDLPEPSEQKTIDLNEEIDWNFGFSWTVIDGLKSIGVYRVSQLLNLTPEQLKNAKGIGPYRVHEIQKILGSYGLHLKKDQGGH